MSLTEAEIEYQILKFDDKERRVQLLHEQGKLLQMAKKSEGEAPEFEWQAEAAKYMIESSPKGTYGLRAQELLSVEPSMTER